MERQSGPATQICFLFAYCGKLPISGMDPHRNYEIRCPVHGFIPFNDWERQIIAQPAYQRLRRIRQLAWTDQVYPGAMHTRFEHSLGVMHTATMLYDAIVRNSKEVLRSELGYNEAGIERNRQLVRLAALLHDAGHSPFSHASEELFPEKDDGERYEHEDYSAAIIRGPLQEAIEDHKLNHGNHGFKAADVAAFIEGGMGAKQGMFWRDLITGQMDADRMDYLLRDSHHAGVHYGKFDLHRLISTIVAIPGQGDVVPHLGIEEGGLHAAEALVLARYFMFTQVYFHKTRVAYDIHIREAMKELLPGGHFPKPSAEELPEFLAWDDWRVLGLLAAGEGGEHGRRLANRDHYRLAYKTSEVQTERDPEKLVRIRAVLGHLVAAEERAAKSWYKRDDTDLLQERRTRKRPGVERLFERSPESWQEQSSAAVLPARGQGRSREKDRGGDPWTGMNDTMHDWR
jgi:HD superfamily phosphohydrolase